MIFFAIVLAAATPNHTLSGQSRRAFASLYGTAKAVP
jgi:hypothetical protein